MGEPASTDHVKRVESELAKEDSLLSNMIQQAPGMLGMAFMFIITILLGIWLQPWFDAAGLQAFGESGSTEVRWIALELVAIFAFTFMILWLAKNHLQHVIKYGILFVLFLALCYTTVPGAHILLVPDIETEEFKFSSTENIEEELYAIGSDGSQITHKVIYRNTIADHSFEVTKRFANSSHNWTTELQSYPGIPNQFSMIEGDYGYTINNNVWIWTLDKETGEVLTKYACFDLENWDGNLSTIEIIPEIGPCESVLEVIDDANASPGERKGALYILTGKNTVVRSQTFSEETVESDFYDNIAIHRKVAEWSSPVINIGSGLIYSKQYDVNSLLIATKEGGFMLELEESSDTYNGPDVKPEGWYDDCSFDWLYFTENDDQITSLNVVSSPWDESENLIMAGESDGKVSAWIIDDDLDGNLTIETRFKGGDSFQGPILDISNFDLDGSDGPEIWIVDGEGAHGLFYKSMIEYVTIPLDSNENSKIIVNGFNISLLLEENYSDDKGNILKMMVVDSGEFEPETMYNVYGIQFDNTAFLVGVIVSVLLMTALIIRPEWYIVNTVGVLVGAGVIVMLGVTFVPTLIVIFMVLAAIYDAWAVYRSKHMLDLADTMIGLNLPILLVAPQESGYSMLDEKDSIRPAEEQKVTMAEPKSTENTPKQVVKRKKPKEAMFMGLGDVIFPGMLVISCVNYISESGLAVGISALIGGLIGYVVLMTYVASGRPQAGLPLLNGGAILGYIIGGLIFVGSAAFSFGITL